MKYDEIIKNFFVAFMAQAIRLVLNVITALFVPKILGASEYGYWQFFIFLTSYVGSFHFGLNDGIYLQYGGISRRGIKKDLVASQFVFGVVYQTILAIFISGIVFIFVKDENRIFDFVLSSVYLVLINAAYFWGFVFQAMDETKLFSFSTICERALFLLLLIPLVIIKVDDFRFYVVAYTVAMVGQLAFSVYNARDFFITRLVGIRETIVASAKSMKLGISLTIANVASTLILGIGRLVIDARWGIETFGQLSFALSLVTFFLVLVSQGSMVLFPALRKASDDEASRFLMACRDVMELAFPVVYLAYYPVTLLLSTWLPQFSSTMVFFGLLLPICVYDSKMDILCTTFFKVNNSVRELLQLNILALAISGIGSLVSAFYFNSMICVVLSMTVSIIIRSVLAERRVFNGVESGQSTIWIGETIFTIVFVIVAIASKEFIISELVLALAYFLFAFCNRKVIALRLKQLRTSFKK